MTVRRVVRILVRVAAVLTAAIVVYVAVTFAQVWSASRQDSHRPAQAIIVLGAAQYDGTPSPVLRNRLDHAIELYEAGIAPFLVVTGGKQPGDRFTEAAASYAYLRRAGIADHVIRREEQGANTWQQLAAASRFLAESGIHDVVLVSDDYHAYRLDRIAHELGLTAQVSPVDAGLSFAGRLRALARETVAVAVGRVVGFRRLVDLDAQVTGVRSAGTVGYLVPLTRSGVV